MAKRQIFYSFHYKKDSWRAAQVKNMGMVEGNTPVSANEWEEVKRKGKNAIENWINSSMAWRSCVIVLIGEDTCTREWCKYEIQHAWRTGKGVVGIYIHGLKDMLQQQSPKGKNPFDLFYIDKTINYIAERSFPNDGNEIKMSCVCKAYDTPYLSSDNVYSYIRQHIEDWVEEAITIRNSYPK